MFSDYLTALMLAAGSSDNPEVITTLAKLGADIHARDNSGKTALIAAAWKNPDPEIVTTLVNLGADINARDNGNDSGFIGPVKRTPDGDNVGKTALMWAVENNNPEIIITTLVELGADINAKDERGLTALTWAASKSSTPRALTTLVRLGADVNGEDTLELTASFNPNREILIAAAAVCPYPEIIANLADLSAKLDLNVIAKNKLGETALMYAAGLNKNPEVVAKLVLLGADVNERDNLGQTALMWAAKGIANPEVITTLIKLGADVNAKNCFGQTALMIAGHNSNPEFEKRLAKAMAEASEAKNTHVTPSAKPTDDKLKHKKGWFASLFGRAES